MYVIVAGGGRTGAQLSTLLLSEGYKVRLVEDRPTVLAHLHKELPTEIIYEGSPVNPDILEQAGIKQANVIAACTADDATNLSLCFIAREMFNIPRTIARVNNPRNAWLFNENFNVDVALNSANVLASLIREEMSMGDMMTLLKLRRGKYSLVEEKVPAGAKAIGVPLKDMGLPKECVIAAVIRKGKITLPHGDFTFVEDDEVLAITDPLAAQQLSALLTPPDFRERGK
jgi:trk system potassium uptake protein TrkA